MSSPHCRPATLALAVCAVLGLSQAAWADTPASTATQVIIGATGVTTGMGQYSAAVAVTHLIDHSGLSEDYTSGGTLFDSYVASATHDGTFAADSWFSNFSTTGTITFDLGSIQTIDAFALWNLHPTNTNSLRQFSLLDSNNNLIGSFSAVKGPGPSMSIVQAQVYSFAQAVTTQFVTLQVNANWGGSLAGAGEVAFRSTTPAAVPEPTSMAMLAAGLGVVGWMARRRKA